MTSLTVTSAVTSAVQLAARLRAGACGEPGYLYDGGTGSPRAPESPEGSLDDPHAAEKRLAAGLMLASAKKRRKQSKPVRIHALEEAGDESAPLALTPRAEPEQLACPHCSRGFSQRGELAHHLEMEHARGGERAASAGGENGCMGSELPLNLSSSQWREREATDLRGQTPTGQVKERYGYSRDAESHDDYQTSQGRGGEQHGYNAGYPRGNESHEEFQTNQRRGSESYEDYRTNQRRGSESHDDYRSTQRRGSESHDDYRTPQRRDSQSAAPEDYRTSQPRDVKTQDDYRHDQRRDSGLSCPEDARGRPSEQDALQTLSSLQRKFSTPGYMPYGPPPLLLPFLSQHMGGQPPSAPTDGKIFNPEAFCELCGKEFCNKYFLRTHKANKHGVFSDAPRSPPTGSSTLLAQQLAATGRQLSPSAESRDSGRPSSESETAARPASDTFCQPCQKEFCDPFFLRQHRAAVHGDAAPPPEETPRPPVYRAPREREPEQGELTRPEPSDPYDARQLSEMPNTTANGREHETPRRFSHDQLRLMGVTNAEAFCNICCKEFCNKYFLKVHRYKMHQIGSPPPERERPPSGSTSGSGGENGNGPAPPPPPVSCPPLEKLLEAPLRDSFPKECDQCGRPFQSSYLLQMHKYYFHGLGQQFTGGLMPPADRPPPPPPPPPKKSKSKKKDSIGDDLKKLQGMIKGLHDKKAAEVVSCHVCTKTLENKHVLQAHLMTEHGMFQSQEEIVIPKPPAPSTSKASSSSSKERSEKPGSSGVGETFCSICKKDFYAKFFLQQHMQTAHGIQAGATLSETAFLARIRREVESQKKPERPKPASTSRSYCEICKKELCNKYFMKTHMTKMHGINLEAHQSRGGATCDVCQKELCSRYFLKVHKQNCHGIRDDTSEPDPRILEETSKDEEGLEVCTVCTGKFKTPKLLEQHMIGEHGAPKEKKSKSSSSSSSAAAAAAAAAAASAAAQLPSIGPTCGLCSQTLPDLLSLRLHMLQAHPLPEQPSSDPGAQAQADEAKVSSLWMREKLLRYPFGPFPGGFPPFLPGLLPQLAGPPSDSPFPLLPFDMPHGLLAQRAAAAAAAAAAARSPERETEPPPSSSAASTSASSMSEADRAAPTVSWAMPSSSVRPSVVERAPATAIKPEQPTSDHPAPKRRQPASASKLHRCVPCGVRFRRRLHFLQHWQQRHSRGRQESAIASAIVKGYLKRRQRCRRCGFTARGRDTLLRHERRHHQRAEPPARCLYGIPLPASEDSTPYRMQSFVISSTSARGEEVIAPALATLPTTQTLSAPAELTVQLLPV